MSYFRELPNVAYQSPLGHKISSTEYTVIKNIFRRTKLLDYLSDKTTLFNKFIIGEGDRPDTIADYYYGDPELDFVVLLTAGVTNIVNDWPLGDHDLYEHTLHKYGTTAKMNEVHHYETKEIRDELNRLILPEGLIVDDEFKIDGPGKKYRVSGAAPITWKLVADEGNITLTNDELSVATDNIAYPVTNFDYEIIENEKKRKIDLLRPEYVQQFLLDFREIMRYDRNSQYISDKLIGTENTRIVGQ
tara:strand:+ start:62 stop:799 length:738 start_codon:yes stop_codon:yes gene_type:complete